MNTSENTRPDQAEMALGRYCAQVTCGQDVRRGETIAISSIPGKGALHAPFPGTVLHVDPYRIRIGRGAGETVDPISLDGLSGHQLRDKLTELGADIPIADVVDSLIVNAVKIEPSLHGRRKLLADHIETLRLGVQALIRAYLPASATMAVTDSAPSGLDDIPAMTVSGQYPAGLDPLVVKAVTGKEAPTDTVVVGLETVHHVGRIIETGLPILETMVTVGDSGRIIPLGTPVGAIAEQDGTSLQDRDRIVLGGVLGGATAASPAQGVDRNTLAVAVVRNPEPVATDAACVGCGECVRHCPARLDPAMISSYAEFGMYDKAEGEHVAACFECGLCGHFCIARRPMLQYIRLAKAELARAAAQTSREAQQ